MGSREAHPPANPSSPGAEDRFFRNWVTRSGTVSRADDASEASRRERAEATSETSEVAMPVATLQQTLRDANRRLDAYRNAREASRLNDAQKRKSSKQLLEENPALAIPARLKEEARNAARALELERAKTKALEERLRAARRDAVEEIRNAEESARLRLVAAESEKQNALRAESRALTEARNVSAALVEARHALDAQIEKSRGFERETRALRDALRSTRTNAEESRTKALADAARSGYEARAGLFSVLKTMGIAGGAGENAEKAFHNNASREIRTYARDASTIASPHVVDPYPYAAKVRSMRIASKTLSVATARSYNA